MRPQTGATGCFAQYRPGGSAALQSHLISSAVRSSLLRGRNRATGTVRAVERFYACAEFEDWQVYALVVVAGRPLAVWSRSEDRPAAGGRC